MVIFLVLSTVVLWSAVLASFLYSLQGFPTPFRDSLTAEQRAIKSESSRQRGGFFGCAFLVSLLLVGGALWAGLRRPPPAPAGGCALAAALHASAQAATRRGR